jgi:uncharacterized phage protein gp47/JayE
MPVEPFAKKDFQTIVGDLLGESAGDAGGRAGLRDANAGSVVRTLMEAFARELALCYEQLDIVWRAGYIETAEGQALDNVVALLGLERRRAGFLVGAVEFSRRQPAEEDIAIPAGTLVAGRGVPPAETTRAATLVKGDQIARVDVQSVAPSTDGKPVPPGALVLMPRPIAGIEAVTNTLALLQRQRAESDAELRARASNAVRRAHTGTKASLETAVRACGVAEVRVIDSADDPNAAPATVAVVIGDTDVDETTLQAVYAAVRDVRPAGIRVSVNKATAISVHIDAVLELTRSVPPEEQEMLREHIVASLKAYFNQLAVGEMLRVAKLGAVLTADDRVAAVEPAAKAGPKDPPLIDPWIGKEQVGASALLSNGDLLVAASQRVVLYTAEGYPKIAFNAPGVRIDLELVLPAADAARRDDVQREAGRLLAAFVTALRYEARQAGQQEPPKDTAIQYDGIWSAVAPVQPEAIRISVVHERDGRVARLVAAKQSDTLKIGELPRPGLVSVTLAPKPGA